MTTSIPPAEMTVLSPHDGTHVGTLPCAGAEEVRAAVAMARKASREWASTTPEERGRLVRAAGRADAQYRQPESMFRQRLPNRCDLRVRHAIAHQQDIAARVAGLREQGGTCRDSPSDIATRRGHESRFHDVQLRLNRAHVIGERGDGERPPGEHHQRCLTPVARGEQVVNFKLGAAEAGRCHVLRLH